MPRKTRTPVSPYEGLRWLEELESGKGVTQIAEIYKRDIRIVKRYIEIARRDREISQARKEFLHGVLELHQKDLLAEVERLLKKLSAIPPSSLEPDEPRQSKIFSGLEEHLAKTSLVKNLGAYSTSLQEYQRLLQEAKDKLDKEEPRIVSGLSQKDNLSNWKGRIISVLEQSSLNDQLYKTVQAGNTFEPTWAGLPLTRQTIKEVDVNPVLDALRSVLDAINDLADSILPLRLKLAALNAELRDDLETLTVRRFIPGSCQYCPF